MTQSRKDLFQAHRLMTQRASLALLRGEPDLPDQPLRRLNVAAFASALTAVIVASLFVILAVLGHGGGPPALGPGALIIDQQTGTAYVFCEKTKLCPVMNYASARLALRSDAPDQQTLSQGSLTHYARGPLIGIPGLPQPLPGPNLLVRQPWSVCERTQVGAAGQHTVAMLAAGVSTGGRALGHGALLIEYAGREWMVWNGERLSVPAASVPALNAPSQPVQVPAALVNVLPAGPDLVPPSIPGRGTRAPGPDGPAVVGQVYYVPAAGTSAQYYVMLAGGLARISQTQARLLQTEHNAPAAARLSLSQVNGHLSRTTVPSRGLPGHVPTFAQISPATTVCTVYSLAGRAGRTQARLMVGGRMPTGGLPLPAGGAASRLVMPPGAGSLVGVAPGGAGHQGTAISYFLVAGGRRYGLAAKDVAGMLGYRLSQQSVLLPLSVVGLIPPGPAMDPAAATRPVPGG